MPRVILLGAGRAGGFHTTSMTQIDNLEVVCVADPQVEKAAEYARVMQRARKNNLDVLGVRHPRRRFADGDGDSTGIFDFNVLSAQCCIFCSVV